MTNPAELHYLLAAVKPRETEAAKGKIIQPGSISVTVAAVGHPGLLRWNNRVLTLDRARRPERPLSHAAADGLTCGYFSFYHVFL